MISRPTVLVLGAGASMDYGLPSGAELVDQLARRLGGGDPTISKLLTQLGHKAEDIAAFKEALVGSQVYSVDAFLEKRSFYVPIGKAAMAYVLSMHEQERWLTMKDHWYKFLWSHLSTQFPEFKKNKLSIITYNYDRLVEQFLFNTMMYTYGESREATVDALMNIPIVHVHGSMGSLQWQDQERFLQYGKRISTVDDLRKAMDSIVVIHESKDESPEYVRAFELLQAAERIYFLGFGFGATNLRRLGISRLDSNKIIKATAKGMSQLRREEIAGTSRLPIQLYPGTGCLDFLREVPLT